MLLSYPSEINLKQMQQIDNFVEKFKNEVIN